MFLYCITSISRELSQSRLKLIALVPIIQVFALVAIGDTCKRINILSVGALAALSVRRFTFSQVGGGHASNEPTRMTAGTFSIKAALQLKLPLTNDAVNFNSYLLEIRDCAWMRKS